MRRQVRTVDRCGRKRCLRNRADAMRALKRIEGRQHEPGLSVYRCAECGWWHVGHHQSGDRRSA